MTRIGKIARLPRDLREQVNCRLLDGQPGIEIVAWLNGLAEVQKMLASLFGGRPVSEQNLSDWRQSGYRDWMDHREAMAAIGQLDEEGEQFAESGLEHLPQDAMRWLGYRMLELARRWRPTGDLEADLKTLADLREECARLRGADLDAARQELQVAQGESQLAELELRRKLEPLNRNRSHEQFITTVDYHRMAARKGKEPGSGPRGRNLTPPQISNWFGARRLRGFIVPTCLNRAFHACHSVVEPA